MQRMLIGWTSCVAADRGQNSKYFPAKFGGAARPATVGGPTQRNVTDLFDLCWYKIEIFSTSALSPRVCVCVCVCIRRIKYRLPPADSTDFVQECRPNQKSRAMSRDTVICWNWPLGVISRSMGHVQRIPRILWMKLIKLQPLSLSLSLWAHNNKLAIKNSQRTNSQTQKKKKNEREYYADW